MSDAADLSVGPPGPPEVDDLHLAGPDDELELEEPGGVELGPRVEEDTIRLMLESGTNLLHELAADPDVPDHWKATDGELTEASRALARIANRSPVVQRVMGGERGDAVALAMAVGRYGVRNVVAQRVAERAREEEEIEDGLETEGVDGGEPGGSRLDDGTSDRGSRWGRPDGGGGPGDPYPSRPGSG